MKKHGKKYVEASKRVEKNKLYNVEEAISLVKETSVTNFDSTVEVAIKLNVDASFQYETLSGACGVVARDAGVILLRQQSWFVRNIVELTQLS